MEEDQSNVELRFARRFRQLREAAKLSRSDVTRLMRDRGFLLYDNALAKIELGQRPIRYGEAWALAEIVQRTPTDLTVEPTPDEDLATLRRVLASTVAGLDESRRLERGAAASVENLRAKIREGEQLVRDLTADIAQREVELEQQKREAELGESGPAT